MNWHKAKTVRADLGAFLEAGDTFRVQEVWDFFGPPVVAGTYEAKPIVIPMPVEERTGHGEFCPFVIVRQPSAAEEAMTGVCCPCRRTHVSGAKRPGVRR